MSYECNKTSDGEYSLVGELCIFHAAEIKQCVLESLSTDDSLELDLSGVNEIDTAGVQLLLFVQREARRLGKTLNLVRPSELVSETLKLLNLEAALGAPARPVTAQELEEAHES